jgi:hypothetical protein
MVSHYFALFRSFSLLRFLSYAVLRRGARSGAVLHLAAGPCCVTCCAVLRGAAWSRALLGRVAPPVLRGRCCAAAVAQPVLRGRCCLVLRGRCCLAVAVRPVLRGAARLVLRCCVAGAALPVLRGRCCAAGAGRSSAAGAARCCAVLRGRCCAAGAAWQVLCGRCCVRCCAAVVARPLLRGRRCVAGAARPVLRGAAAINHRGLWIRLALPCRFVTLTFTLPLALNLSTALSLCPILLRALILSINLISHFLSLTRSLFFSRNFSLCVYPGFSRKQPLTIVVDCGFAS